MELEVDFAVYSKMFQDLHPQARKVDVLPVDLGVFNIIGIKNCF